MSVASGTPADDAGLGAGDVIVALGGRAVTSPTSLRNVMNLHHPGDRVQLRWVDQAGESHSATVTLATGPPA
jgi:S1-C subfamily serine protease